jgi:hypothetical protein
MKRLLFLLWVIPFLLVSGCAREKETDTAYSAAIDGQEITILFNEGTRSAGTILSENGVYTFAYSLGGTFSVVYPNGYEYSQTKMNGAIAASPWNLNESAEELGFIDGFDLESAVSSASRPTSRNPKAVSPVISVLLTGGGLLSTFRPRSLWWLSRGWMYKNAEPSDLALAVYCITGIFVAFIGLISFFA